MIVDELRGMLVAITGRADLADLAVDTPLFGDVVRLDSLTGVRLLAAVLTRYQVDVAAEDLNLDALTTLTTLANFIASRHQSS